MDRLRCSDFALGSSVSRGFVLRRVYLDLGVPGGFRLCGVRMSLRVCPLGIVGVAGMWPGIGLGVGFYLVGLVCGGAYRSVGRSWGKSVGGSGVKGFVLYFSGGV